MDYYAREAFKKVKQDFSEVNKKIENLNISDKDLTKRLKEIDEQLIDLSKKLDKTYRQVRKRENLKGEIKSINQLKQEVELLNRKITEKHDYLDKLEQDLNKHTLKLTEDIGQIGSDFLSIKRQQVLSIDEIENLKKDIEQRGKSSDTKLNQSISQLKQEIEDLGKEITDIQDSKKENSEFDNAISELNHKINEKDRLIDRLNKKFRENVITDKALYNEIRKLNKNIEGDKKFKLDRTRFEEKLQRYKEERVDSFRSMILPVFLAVAVFAVLAFYYFRASGLVLPGIANKMIFVLIMLVVLLAVFLTPKNIFIKIKDCFKFDVVKKNISNFINFLAGKK